MFSVIQILPHHSPRDVNTRSPSCMDSNHVPNIGMYGYESLTCKPAYVLIKNYVNI